MYQTRRDSDDGPGPTQYIWSYERWVVEWVSHPFHRPGDRTTTEVNFYVATRRDYGSHVDMVYDSDGNSTVYTGGRGRLESSDLFVIMEEAGVLWLGEDRYPDHTKTALKRVRRAISGNLVLYGPDPDEIRRRWALNKIPFRILDFLPTQVTFAQAASDFLQAHYHRDYIILSGASGVDGPKVIQCGPLGLKLKTKQYVEIVTSEAET
jgi:hypothetical protein